MQMVQVRCKASAALLNNNLSASLDHVGYITGGECHVFPNKSQSFSSTSRSMSITKVACDPGVDSIDQLRFVSTFGTPGLVLLHGKTSSVFSEDGTTLAGSYTSQDSLSGIASDAKSLYIGEGNAILSFNGNMNSSARLSGASHTAPITLLDTHENFLVSGDESGAIYLWTNGAAPAQVFAGAGFPVTGLRIAHSKIFAAFASGHLRRFDLASKALEAEVAAHTRSISAMDVCLATPQVALASEDAHVSVWDMKADPVNRAHFDVSQTLLTGVQYVGPQQSHVAVTAYDSRTLSVFARPN
jgi:hypothetical protein